MLTFLPPFVRGIIAALILTTQTLLLVPLLLFVALLKLLLPIPPLRVFCTRVGIGIAEIWISINSGWMRLTQKLEWDVEMPESLNTDSWYLVTSNHQSWADITILQHLLNRRIPMLKFFLKQELIWVPVIGLAWWALDFPFMKRYTQEYLRKHPEKKGKDLETTRKACEKFKHTPVAVFNFLEGTRFTPAKHERQQSPFQHLLRPKAGGIGFVLGAMGEQLDTLLNVTIYYADSPESHRPSYWDFLCGRVNGVVVRMAQQPIPAEFRGGDYLNDDGYREQFQLWVNRLWEEKDQQLSELACNKTA
ncbi:acyltransferase [Aestuariirhabdus litorea]|uniref:Acyltransferase n=1 Tax=Aestuariirhabdus litorea TaxID=2528527 RepID=A0A3P3VVA9_9GAMM|nr:acyltransferase [Aestuariirhabdus litorea]RRJ85379.1 acyltransferase [Aestuariirhabdus litorea]RWW98603.1 acyltransferase [Endozoicomonadaceae bacterium GTF-13]